LLTQIIYGFLGVKSHKQMESEKAFATYLEDQRLLCVRDYHVGPGNFDFRVETHCEPIYCDVKEIHDSDIESVKGIDAHLHLRGDIRKLRNKYKGKKLDVPVVLVAMNFSSNYFTGLTVARALMGDVGITFDRSRPKAGKPLHHIPNGDAAFTKNQNTSISGVFVFDRAHGEHCFFENPNAKPRMPRDLFHNLRFITLSRSTVGQELIDLGKIWFWNCG